MTSLCIRCPDKRQVLPPDNVPLGPTPDNSSPCLTGTFTTQLRMDSSLQTVMTHYEGVVVWGTCPGGRLFREARVRGRLTYLLFAQKKNKSRCVCESHLPSLSIVAINVVVFRICSMEQCRWISCTSVVRSLPVLTTVVPSPGSTCVAAEHIQVTILVPCYFSVNSLLQAYILRYYE